MRVRNVDVGVTRATVVTIILTSTIAVMVIRTGIAMIAYAIMICNSDQTNMATKVHMEG